jgi:N-acetylmuramic acid 6-phosphate etherase
LSDELRITERPNENTRDLDLLSPLEVVRLINREDVRVAEAVGRCDAKIAEAVEAIMRSFASSGRLIYVGAGTSGRLGVLDASECPPTFSTPEDQVVGIIAGGDWALRHASEGAEDDPKAGAAILREHKLVKADTVCGVTASGRTPYVQGALQVARKLGCFTILVTCNASAELLDDADCVISPEVGPEVIAGSTRLKAGTATKLVLNTLSTTALALSGKVYSNLMVDLRPGSLKLVSRARWILSHLLGIEGPRAAKLFESAGRNVKVAVLMGKLGISREAAEKLLRKTGGYLRKSLDAGGRSCR